MKKIFIVLIISALFACNGKTKKSDAYGNFEAIETIISSEATGKILELNIEEGQVLEIGKKVCVVDTVQLYLKKLQLLAQKKAINSKSANVLSQIDVFNEQKNSLLIEKKRVEKLLKEGAATQRQLDDIDGKIKVIDSQIGTIRTQNAAVFAEYDIIAPQLDQINDQLKRCYIINPVKGTVLTKYAEAQEMISAGKALYKIADLSEMALRVFVEGSQLSNVKIGQNVKVLIDKDENSTEELTGIISWISDKGEFTPKIIQTRKERVNLVYALKVKVKNDGRLKIAMPGEVLFN